MLMARGSPPGLSVVAPAGSGRRKSKVFEKVLWEHLELAVARLALPEVGLDAVLTGLCDLNVRFVKVKNTTTQIFEQRVHVNGFGKDRRGKKMARSRLLMYSEAHGHRRVIIWRRNIEEHWRVRDYAEIKDMTMREIYRLKVQEAAANGRSPFRRKDIALDLAGLRCTLLASGTCSITHICKCCKAVTDCLAYTSTACLSCSVRIWEKSWRIAKVDKSHNEIHERDEKRLGPQRPSLGVDEPQHLLVSQLPMAPARIDRRYDTDIKILRFLGSRACQAKQ